MTSSTTDHGDRPSWLRVVKRIAYPACAADPDVLEHVAFDEDAPRVLQLERVLHLPLLPAPLERLREVVAPDGDVGWHQVGDRRIGAAEQDVLACAFEIVVLDEVRAGAVPAGNRLAVLPDHLDVGDVAVDDLRRAAVERDAALLAGHDDRHGRRRGRRSGCAASALRSAIRCRA